MSVNALLQVSRVWFIFSMQLCVDASIPECFGGVGGEAIFIDTEGSFVAERVLQIAEATVNHCRFVTDSTKDPGRKKQLLVCICICMQVLYKSLQVSCRYLFNFAILFF